MSSSRIIASARPGARVRPGGVPLNWPGPGRGAFPGRLKVRAARDNEPPQTLTLKAVFEWSFDLAGGVTGMCECTGP